MKQRLLYAILLLFGVFGMAKAEDNPIKLTIPKGEATSKVVVTVTGSGYAADNRPWTDNPSAISTFVDATTVQFTVYQDPLAEILFKFYAEDQVITGLDINGKVTKFDASGVSTSSNISQKLTSLSFSAGAGLTTLNLLNSSSLVFPNLEKLIVTKNNLEAIPSIASFSKMSIAGYQVGEQTPGSTITWGGVDGKASNTSIDLLYTEIQLGGVAYLPAGDGLNDYYYTDWKVKNAQGEYVTATGEAAAHGDATYPYRYMFYDASTKVYASAGDYTTSLVFTSSHTHYPGVKIMGIPVSVAVPKFSMTKEVLTDESTTTGSIDVKAVTGTGLVDFNTTSGEAKDTQLQITFAPKSGYSFDRNNTSLWSVKGLKDLQWTNNVLSCKIKGDVDIEVKASFVGEPRTVTFSAPEHAKSVDVYILDGKKLNSGDVFPFGSKLEIIPIPEDGYKVGTVTAGSITVPLNTDGKYVTSALTDNVSIVVTFVPDVTTYKIYWDSNSTYVVSSGAVWNAAGYHEALKDAEIVFTAAAPAGKTLSKVLKDGVEIPNEGTGYYRFIMPDHDVNITSEVGTVKPLTLTAKSQTVEYTGNGIPFTDYTIKQGTEIIPNSSVDGIEVWYKTTGADPTLYTKDLRTDCGTYDVKITRAAKDGYGAISENTDVVTTTQLKLTITPAMPQVTLPTEVKVVERTKADNTKYYQYEQTGGSVKNVTKYAIAFVKTLHTSPQGPEDDILYDKAVANSVTPHTVMMRFMVMKNDTERDLNYLPYYQTVPVKVNGSSLTTYKVTLKQPAAGTLKMYNGLNELPSGSMVAVGTTLTFKTTGITNMSSHKIAPVDDQGNINTNLLPSPTLQSGTTGSQDISVIANMTVAVVGTTIDLNTIVLRENRKKIEFDYTGDPQAYPLKDESDSRFAEKSAPTTALTSSSDPKVPTDVTVSYFYNNTPVIQPKEAGTYKVVLTAEANTDSKYAAFSLTDEMVIKPVDPVFPTNSNLSATALSIGQKLSQSQISGKAPVEGTFEWVEKDKVVKADYEGYVRFIPKDTRNYNSIILNKTVTVKVDSKLRVMYAPVNGTITVKDKNGKEYAPGTEVTKGLELTITAKANTGYYFESMTINDTKYSSSTRTLTVGDVSVSIEASFQQEAASAVLAFSSTSGGTLSVVRSRDGYIYSNNAKVDLNTQLTVTATANTGFKLKSLTINGRVYTTSPQVIQFTGTTTISAVFEKENPESVILTFPTESEVSGKGFTLNVYGAQSYDFGKEITLVVSTLVEDAKNIVVKAGSTTVAANKDGSYTIKADAEKSISVSLSKTPTPLKVAIEMVTKNAKGYVMGHVEIIPASSLRAVTPTYYYGDKVTLIAYPESGVTFAYWSDDRTNKSNVRTITLTKDIDIKPVFKGVPTDVESIESAEVIGGDDCIIIRGVADARVTIVSMDGRSQQQMVNGDTRINVRAGVYGVILEQGKAVIREKIVVR